MDLKWTLNGSKNGPKMFWQKIATFVFKILGAFQEHQIENGLWWSLIEPFCTKYFSCIWHSEKMISIQFRPSTSHWHINWYGLSNIFNKHSHFSHKIPLDDLSILFIWPWDTKKTLVQFKKRSECTAKNTKVQF